jgi:hypothetical protein
LGKDLESYWSQLNLNPTLPAFGLYYPAKHQYWLWTQTTSQITNIFMFDVLLGQAQEEGVRGGWVVWDGTPCTARHAAMFANTLGATVSLDAGTVEFIAWFQTKPIVAKEGWWMDGLEPIIIFVPTSQVAGDQIIGTYIGDQSVNARLSKTVSMILNANESFVYLSSIYRSFETLVCGRQRAISLIIGDDRFNDFGSLSKRTQWQIHKLIIPYRILGEQS